MPPPPPWAPKRLAPQSRRQRSSSFPWPTRFHAHRCSCWRANTAVSKAAFDLLTLKVVSESRVTWATSAPISVSFPLCSGLRPDVRDRRQTDVRQHHRFMPPPVRGGSIMMNIKQKRRVRNVIKSGAVRTVCYPQDSSCSLLKYIKQL